MELLLEIKNKDKINISFAINNSYIDHCCATIKSILKNVSIKYQLNFFILSEKLSEKNKQILIKAANTNFSKVQFIEINPEDFSTLPTHKYNYFKVVNYFRIKIPSLLPSIDKMIYLDSDLIVNSDISVLWEIQLGNNYLACAEDNVPETKRLQELIELPDDYIYYNSGVLVLNCKKWRDDNIEEKLFEFGKKFYDNIYIVDQDLLNLTINRDIIYFDKYWNYQVNFSLNTNPNIDLKNIKIIHYLGPLKAFHMPVFNKLSRIYYQHIKPLKIISIQYAILKEKIKKIFDSYKKEHLFFKNLKGIDKQSTIILIGKNNITKRIINSKKMKDYKILAIVDPLKQKEEVIFCGYNLFYPYVLEEFRPDYLINTYDDKNVKEYINDIRLQYDLKSTQIDL